MLPSKRSRASTRRVSNVKPVKLLDNREKTMTIQVGDRLPQSTFRTMGPEGRPVEKTTDDVFKGKKVVLFAVPGAFTPTCHRNHMPGFVAKADEIKAKGVDAIVVTSGNGLGVRSKRYSMIVEDGVVKSLNVEETPGKAEVSGADNLLKTMGTIL